MSQLIFLFVIIALPLAYTQHPKFGKSPSIKRLEKSPNYKKNKFQNLVPKKMWTGQKSHFSIFKDILKKDLTPKSKIPSIKSDLKNLDMSKNLYVWFGHSSYLFQINKKVFLVDPVFSKYASPVPFFVKAFDGTNIYSYDDLPEIDYLVITHDHWDHLDYNTILGLKKKIKKVICGYGLYETFKLWGFNDDQIIELDWWQKKELNKEIIIHAFPTQHFSGRLFKRNQTLWCSYLIESNDIKVYIGGDSGYEKHFKMIGERFDSIDVAILENGQYNENWAYHHMFPKQTLEAAKDLKAKILIPVHNSKFKLSLHRWDEPLEALSRLAEHEKIKLFTPIIGQVVDLEDLNQRFEKWWKSVK